MRSIIVLLFVSTISYGQKTADDVKKLDWLTGTWTRTNVKAGHSGHEVWNARNGTTITGRGVNMKGVDTTFVEKFRLELKDGQIYYIADVPENKGEVFFKITDLTSKSFVCENPQHDFPKKISYVLDGKNLKATISGDGKAIDYLFIGNSK